jgi:hypothetical protein
MLAFASPLFLLIGAAKARTLLDALLVVAAFAILLFGGLSMWRRGYRK